MTQFIDALGFDASDTVVRLVAYALPLAVLFTLLALLAMKAKKKAKLKAKAKIDSFSERPASASSAAAAIEVRISPPQSETLESPLRADVPASSAAPMSPVALVQNIPVDAANPPAGHAPPADAAVPDVRIANLKAKLQDAATLQPKSAIAPLYLELARQCRATGDEAACLAALRSAALHATQHGPRTAHAEARLELAEAAYKSGDLIGACEQWQMARTAYHEEGQKAAYANIEKRMRDHGCPTDWVLTDF